MSVKSRVVYGINTGFGNFADKIISHEALEKLQVNLIRSHAVGVGKPLRPEIIKRMMILRINTLSKGRSGMCPINLKRYIEAYNQNYLPMIPEKGTVGASGDLAPLSHLALGMLGEGLAWNEQENDFTDAAKIMEAKKLKPIELQEKEGLALINGTQFMSAIISEVETLSRVLFDSAIVVFAFAAEIFGLEVELLSD